MTTRRKPKLDEDEIKELADEVFEERMNPEETSIFSHSRNSNDESEFEDFEDDDLSDEVKMNDAFDIFDDIVNKYADQGSLLKYYIFKNGEQVATRQGKYSWQDVQEDFEGGGAFKIVVKRPNGKFFKQQVRHVADGKKYSKGKENSADSGVKDILTTLMQMNNSQNERFEKLLQQNKNDERQSGNQATTLMAGMMQTMAQMFSQPKQDTSLEFMKMMMEMNNKAQERTEKLIDNISRSMRESLEALSSTKEEGPSALELWKEIQEAEQRGRKEEREANEAFEKKLKDRELELKNSEGTKSITDRVLESALPALLSGTMNRNMALPSAPVPQAKPVAQIKRPAKIAPTMQADDDLPRSGVSKTASKPSDKRTMSGQGTSSKTSSTASNFKPLNEDFEDIGSNLKEIPMDDNYKPTKPVEPKRVVEVGEKWWLDETGQAKSYVGHDKDGNMLDEAGIAIEESIIQTLLPIIGNGLLTQTSVTDAVEASIHQLLPLQIDLEDFDLVFNKGKIFQLTEASGVFEMARNQGSESELVKWLGGYYDQLVEGYTFIQSQTGNDAT